MGIESKQVQYAKELDDVGVLLVTFADTVKQGKPLAGVVDELVSAIEGIGEVDEELAANRRVALSTLGARLGELIDALLAPKAPGKPAEPEKDGDVV